MTAEEITLEELYERNQYLFERVMDLQMDVTRLEDFVSSLTAWFVGGMLGVTLAFLFTLFSN